MRIRYLELSDKWSDDGRLQLRGSTHGCGCCAEDIQTQRSDEAEKLLDSWEEQLRARLADIEEMRERLSELEG